MKKIITAMANYTLNNELQRYNNYEVIENDLFYQEAVLDIITEEKFDVLVVSALLQGQLEFGDFIEKVRKIDKTMRIIVVTDEISSSLKRKLNENDIVDIFEDSDVQIPDIIDAIDREEPIRKRYEILNEENKKYEYDKNCITKEEVKNKASEFYEIKREIKEKNNRYNARINITQKQEVIAISGINGSGKSTIAANFARVLSGKTTSKVLLIDLDTLNGNIDEILDINKIPQNVEINIDENKKCGLNYAVELISKNRFDANVFDELVINIGTIDVLTGNTSLHYCQNVLCEEHYNKILECAKEKYDFIVIDTSSNIFLDSTKWALGQANRIFFVTENNYISMKKSAQLISVFTDTWGIWKDKIELIVNKENVSGIESEVIKKILKDYEIIGKIKYGEEELEISYSRILETINYIPKTNILSRLFSVKSIDFLNSNRIPVARINEQKGEMIHVN